MQRRSMWGWSIVITVTFALGVVAGRYYGSSAPLPELEPISSDDSAATDPDRQTKAVYVCPMHPQVVSDQPGICPVCGMALVSAKHNDTEHEHAADMDMRPAVQVDPEVMNSLGVKTAPVVRTTLTRRIEIPGFVQQIQPGQTARVVAPFDARIVTLPFKPGQWLEQGQALVTLESDALRAAEDMYLNLFLQGASAASAGTTTTGTAGPAPSSESDAAQPTTLEQSRKRLAELGLTNEAIAKLEKTREVSSQLTLYAPFPGMVTNLQVAADTSVARGTALFEFSGMMRATVLANAFQRDAAWIQSGQAVEVRMPHVSNQTWQGVINQGAVSIDPNSQNIGVRLTFTAQPQLLKSAMYVVATIFGDPHEAVLAVPQQSLIRTETEDRVILALGHGRFKPVPVTIGIETGENVEILDGLKEGDQVVVSAQFLIDSESSLQASFLRLTGP